MRSELAETFPHAFWQPEIDRSERSVPCAQLHATPAVSCGLGQCPASNPTAQLCASTTCAADVAEQDDACLRCLVANSDRPALCSRPPGARARGFDGRNGLLLVSRRPMLNPSYRRLPSTLVNRAVLTAEIERRRVHCTQLSTDLRDLPNPAHDGLLDSRDEQLAQIDLIHALTPADQCAVLLGSLNIGPSTATLTAESPDAWQALLAAGYAEPWTTPSCTWCTDNPVAGAFADLQLDHIMLRGGSGSTSYSRVLDTSLPLDVAGSPVDARRSDHYGVQVIIELAP